jgi:hypothetical protein
VSVFRSKSCVLAGVRTALRAGVPLLVLAHLTTAGAATVDENAHARLSRSPIAVDGVRFACDQAQLDALLPAMTAYLHAQGIDSTWLTRELDQLTGQVRYVLATPASDTDTLSLSARPEYAIKDEVVLLPGAGGKLRKVPTVSQKEIVLALFQHGRLTEFPRSACTVEAFRDHVRVRQNIVAWAESLEWDWPNGGSAKWNQRYWNKGTPHRGVPVHTAVLDAFTHQSRYAIGCYTATKLLVEQGVLDYYYRIKKDGRTTAALSKRLLADSEPLVNLEPGLMWDFETDYDPTERARPGKLLRIQYAVAPGNFVPGDWSYFLNTDAASYEKTGYEGSNAVYLGRDRFDDYYNDNNHSYSYKEKLDEVWQWRHGVFSRSRDADKVQPLTTDELAQLSKPPRQGGLLNDFRVYPYFFGFEALPTIPRP